MTVLNRATVIKRLKNGEVLREHNGGTSYIFGNGDSCTRFTYIYLNDNGLIKLTNKGTIAWFDNNDDKIMTFHDIEIKPMYLSEVRELAEKHCEYTKGLLSFTEQPMTPRERWLYVQAGIHFYKHGFNDAKRNNEVKNEAKNSTL